MTDTVTPEQRSRNMAAIRAHDTQPELRVRRFLHAGGLRFRLYRRDLPGCPDVVFPSRRTVVFVQGCFWHGCPHCRHGARAVKSNKSYWLPKLARNRARDKKNRARLGAFGWSVITVWECQTRELKVLKRLAEAIRSRAAKA